MLSRFTLQSKLRRVRENEAEDLEIRRKSASGLWNRKMRPDARMDTEEKAEIKKLTDAIRGQVYTMNVNDNTLRSALYYLVRSNLCGFVFSHALGFLALCSSKSFEAFRRFVLFWCSSPYLVPHVFVGPLGVPEISLPTFCQSCAGLLVFRKGVSPSSFAQRFMFTMGTPEKNGTSSFAAL